MYTIKSTRASHVTEETCETRVKSDRYYLCVTYTPPSKLAANVCKMPNKASEMKKIGKRDERK